jgi:hypothetical protein
VELALAVALCVEVGDGAAVRVDVEIAGAVLVAVRVTVGVAVPVAVDVRLGEGGGVAVLVGVLVRVGLVGGPGSQPFSAASMALIMHLTLTRPVPSQSKRGQWSSGRAPTAIFSPFTISSTVTVPLLLQSPTHGGAGRRIVASTASATLGPGAKPAPHTSTNNVVASPRRTMLTPKADKAHHSRNQCTWQLSMITPVRTREPLNAVVEVRDLDGSMCIHGAADGLVELPVAGAQTSPLADEDPVFVFCVCCMQPTIRGIAVTDDGTGVRSGLEGG